MSFIQEIFSPITIAKENLKSIETKICDLNTTILNEINESKKTTLVKDFNRKVKEIINKYSNLKNELLKKKIKNFKVFNIEKRDLIKSMFISRNILSNIFKNFIIKNPNYFLKVLNYPQKMNYPNSNNLTIFSENYLCLISRDFPKSYLNKIKLENNNVDIVYNCWNIIKKDQYLNNKIFPLFQSSLDKLLVLDPLILNELVDFPIFNYINNKFLLDLSTEDINFLEKNICNKNINLRKSNKVLSVFPEIQEAIENNVLNNLYQSQKYLSKH